MKKNIQDTFKAYFELEEQIAELQAQQEALKSQLREELAKSNSNVYEEGIYKMQLIEAHRNVFDSKSFAATHPRLAKKFTRQAEYTQFRVSRKASNKEVR